MHTLVGHSDMVLSVALSPDGDRVVSGSIDKLENIWDTETGAEVSSFVREHSGWRVKQGVGLDFQGGGSRGVRRWMRSESGVFCVVQVHTLTGHKDVVYRVAFNHDGAQVVSCSIDDTVRWWDVASGRQVRQLAGNAFALVERLCGEHKRDRHVITITDITLRIYEVGNEEQHTEDGVAAAPVACFKAPQQIRSVRCFGATILVGCEGGAVCILSAPFLAA